MQSMIVRLPWPDPRLMPNRSKGRAWQSLSKLRDEQRFAGNVCTKASLKASGASNWGSGYIPLSLLFLSPDKRHRDLDNLLAALKPVLDGMAEALGVNDKQFKPILIDQVHAGNEGAVIAAVGVSIQSGVSL